MTDRRKNNLNEWKKILLEMLFYKLVFTDPSLKDVERLRDYFECGYTNDWIEDEIEDMLKLAKQSIHFAHLSNIKY